MRLYSQWKGTTTSGRWPIPLHIHTKLSLVIHNIAKINDTKKCQGFSSDLMTPDERNLLPRDTVACQSVSKNQQKQRTFKTAERSDCTNNFRITERKWTPPRCSYHLSMHELPKATVRILIILSIGRKFEKQLHKCWNFIESTKPF